MKLPAEIEIGGQVYRLGQMDAMLQFHVARKLAPVVASLGTSVFELKAASEPLEQDQWILKALGPVMNVVASMDKDAVDFIMTSSLGVVSRRAEDGRFTAIQVANKLMFLDINMPTMFRLVVEVLKENLGSFFGEALGGLT